MLLRVRTLRFHFFQTYLDPISVSPANRLSPIALCGCLIERLGPCGGEPALFRELCTNQNTCQRGHLDRSHILWKGHRSRDRPYDSEKPIDQNSSCSSGEIVIQGCMQGILCAHTVPEQSLPCFLLMSLIAVALHLRSPYRCTCPLGLCSLRLMHLLDRFLLKRSHQASVVLKSRRPHKPNLITMLFCKISKLPSSNALSVPSQSEHLSTHSVLSDPRPSPRTAQTLTAVVYLWHQYYPIPCPLCSKPHRHVSLATSIPTTKVGALDSLTLCYLLVIILLTGDMVNFSFLLCCFWINSTLTD